MSDRLDDRDELLLRQVPAAFMRESRVSSQAFTPGRNDDRKLSVARGSMTSPEAAFDHHTRVCGRQSVGTWAVSVGECANVDLAGQPDPLASPPEPAPDPAHAIIDFGGMSKGQVESKAQILARHATTRGRLWPRAS